MRVASLFAGIGGFDLAFIRHGHEIVYANEWDSYAADIYDYHFEHTIDRRDITTVGADELPEFDCLVEGFPCQAFSVAGKRLGFLDTRGTLFFDIARILDQRRPRCFVLENVKGLLSHDGGQTFRIIIETLDGLGYDLQWQVLNSKDFGVPQNRERVFIVGHLRGLARPQVFPLAGENNPVGQEYVGSIGTPRWPDQDHLSRGHKQPARVFDPSGVSPTLSSQETQGRYNILVDAAYPGREPRTYTEVAPTVRNYGSGGNKMPMVSRIPLKFLERNQRSIEGDYAYTVDSMNTGGVMVDMRIRRLTPTECERLQGFPDGWTAEGINGSISDTRRYKVLGNALTVNVAEAIIERLTDVSQARPE